MSAPAARASRHFARAQRDAAAPIALLLASCAKAQSAVDPVGDQAAHEFKLLILMLWVCGIAYLMVIAFLGWALWRSRRRFPRGEVADDASRWLQRGLVGWAVLITVGLTILSAASFLVDRALAAARDREALRVKVTGHQWWWRIQYLDPATGDWVETANELHLPAGRTARLELGAADVIHSFWVPSVSGKMDAIPGRLNVLDVTPRMLGWKRGQCAEFCGTQHAKMAFDVKVETPAEFDAWLAAQARPAASDGSQARGAAVVAVGQCAACHVVRGTAAAGRAGPDLTHVASRRNLAAGEIPNNRGAIEGWIADPQTIKPGAMMPAVSLSIADREAAAAYLETLR
jgi:cytochrome c oxidase subunit 2